MRDQFERNINYMRVSVTDRCNLRCVYCMPKDGVQQISHDDITINFFRIEKMYRISTDIHKHIRKIYPVIDRFTSQI